MITQFLSYLTEGRFWIVKVWLFSLAATLLFSCMPAVLLDGPFWEDTEATSGAFPLPPAYQVKANQPLADTAVLQFPVDPGSQSHGAKLTPRVLSAACLYVARKCSLHPYLPATLGGCLYLLSGVIVGYRITRDRQLALGISLILAGLYTSNACFSMNFEPKPFDGIAIGWIALTLMLIDRPYLFSGSAFLACWTDERAILSLGLIGLTSLLLSDLELKSRWNRCWMLAGAVLSYFAVRKVVAMVCQWSPADMSMLGDNLLGSASYGQLATWTCLEGAWILVALAIWKNWQIQARLNSIALSAAAVGCIVSCLIVLDISRAGSFAFPLIFASLAALFRHSNPAGSRAELGSEVSSPTQPAGNRRRTGKSDVPSKKTATESPDAKNRPWGANGLVRPVSFAALISLISTNLEVIAGMVFQPCRSMPVWLLQTLSYYLERPGSLS